MLKVKDFEITVPMANNANVRKVKTSKNTPWYTTYVKKYYRVENSAYAFVVHSSYPEDHPEKEEFSHVSFEECFSMGLFKGIKLTKIFNLPTNVVHLLKANKDFCKIMFIIAERVKNGSLKVPTIALNTSSKRVKKEEILKFFSFVRKNDNNLDCYDISSLACWEFYDLLSTKRNLSVIVKYILSLAENTTHYITADEDSSFIENYEKRMCRVNSVFNKVEA